MTVVHISTHAVCQWVRSQPQLHLVRTAEVVVYHDAQVVKTIIRFRKDYLGTCMELARSVKAACIYIIGLIRLAHHELGFKFGNGYFRQPIRSVVFHWWW